MVSGLSGVASISAGFNHTCAVTTAGAAKCWGANESGELGDGTTHNRTKPVTVYHAGAGVAQISAGGYKKKGMTCLVTTGGSVQCFGSNNGVHNLAPIDSHGGQLGDGTTIQRHIPITVRTLTGASPANYRPDLLISKHAGGGYAGNHIYNTSGANQTKATAMAPGGTRHFFVRVQNDSAQGGLVLPGRAALRARLRDQLLERRQEHPVQRHVGHRTGSRSPRAPADGGRHREGQEVDPARRVVR